MEIEDFQDSQSHHPIPSRLKRHKKVLRTWYEDFEVTGTGNFGDVYSLQCKHRVTKQTLIVKIIIIPKNDNREAFLIGLLIQANILRELNHVNVLRLLRVLNEEDNYVYLIFEHLDLNLHRFLVNPLNFKYPRLIKNFLHQILSGLECTHSQGMLHRDLRPQNVLVHFRTQVVKLAEFDMSRKPKTLRFPFSSDSSDGGSHCYKAPELLLGFTNYSTETDIWSVGCIFAEMVTGRPLFSGDKENRILARIFDLLGTPTQDTWPGVPSASNFVRALDITLRPKDLAEVFPTLEPAGVDLLSELLCMCPKYRISARGAVNHPYFNRM